VTDAEFRRRAHVVIAAIVHDPNDDSVTPVSRHFAELQVLDNAGPSMYPYVVEAGGDTQLVVGMVATWLCPQCGPTTQADSECDQCGADVFRSDALWFRRHVWEIVSAYAERGAK
jgi:rubrerythrin